MAGHLALTSRRRFLSAGLVGLTLKAERNIGGSFVNESHTLGHRLRDRSSFKVPTRKVRIPLVIVGGGMAGLSAAWRLDKAGFRDFALLEMAPQAGGNSRWGENEISAYPWAAHYVPIPNRKSSSRPMKLSQNGNWDVSLSTTVPQNGETNKIGFTHRPTKLCLN